MEDHLSEGEGAFFHISEDLVQHAKIRAAGTSEVDFDGLLAKPLKLHENLANGCGGQLWPAGMVLAKYMLRRPEEMLKDKTILEIGCGGGLVGLAVAAGCTGFKLPLHLTDQQSMLDLMKENVHLNLMDKLIEASVYNWGEPIPEGLPNKPDIVLAADCVYFEPSFPLLYQTLLDLIGPHTVCYFCFKKRRRADMNFIKTIKRSFEVSDVIDDPDQDIYRKESIFLLRIQQKRDK